MRVSLRNPINRRHPLNAGRALWLYGLPPWAGGGTWRDLCRRADATLAGPPAWTPTPYGAGLSFAAGAKSVRAQAVAVPGLPTGPTAPWTSAVWHRTRTYVSLSQVWGFGPALDGSSSGPGGGNRYLLQFSNDYYFWGEGADWDTGVPWDADGQWHRVVFTFDGTSLRLYRDGRLAAGPATDGVSSWTTAGTAVTAGSSHPGAATGPDCDVADATIATRAWSAAEAALDYAESRRGYPGLLRRVRQRVVVPAAAAGTRRRRVLIAGRN